VTPFPSGPLLDGPPPRERRRAAPRTELPTEGPALARERASHERARDHLVVTAADVSLRPFSREDLPAVEAWFRDPHTRRFLGGPEWPAVMLARDGRIVGEAFRGATQTGVYRYLAHADGHPFGYVDCGTFDRCTVYGGEGPHGPIITEMIDVVTGSIAFAVDPKRRRRGLGRAMIGALPRRPELRQVELFEAGVEPENVASRQCLEAAGFRVRSELPDCEGMLYYRAWRASNPATTTQCGSLGPIRARHTVAQNLHAGAPNRLLAERSLAGMSTADTPGGPGPKVTLAHGDPVAVELTSAIHGGDLDALRRIVADRPELASVHMIGRKASRAAGAPLCTPPPTGRATSPPHPPR